MVDRNIQNKHAVNYNRAINSRFSEICDPLKIIGVRAFTYYRVFESGEYIFLSNNTRLVKRVIQEFIQAGEYCRKNIRRTEVGKMNFMIWPEKGESEMTQFYAHEFGLGNGCCAYRRQEDGSVEAWGFLADKDNIQILSDYINHKDVFVKFIDYFNVQAQDMISPNHLDIKARYATPMDISAEKQTLPMELDDFITGLGDTNPIHLTQSEQNVLELLCQGKTMKEMGHDIGISHRTVETHIQNVKKKTNLHYRSQLIDFYRKRRLVS